MRQHIPIFIQILLNLNQNSTKKTAMLSNDELSHILSFLDWRDLVFCSLNVSIQFKQETINALNRVTNILICCNGEDCFCIQFLRKHNLRMRHLCKVWISWNGHDSIPKESQCINRFIVDYRSQLTPFVCYHKWQ